MTELFPNLWKDIGLQIQEAKHKPNSVLLTKIKRKRWRNAEKNMIYYIKGAAIQMIMDVLSETMKIKR